MTDSQQNAHEPTEQPELNEAPAPTYEITATDHINKNMLESFKVHLENNTIKVPDNDEQDSGNWDD